MIALTTMLGFERHQKAVAGGLGFEPRQPESESGVLPLDDPPTGSAFAFAVGEPGFIERWRRWQGPFFESFVGLWKGAQRANRPEKKKGPRRSAARSLGRKRPRRATQHLCCGAMEIGCAARRRKGEGQYRCPKFVQAARFLVNTLAGSGPSLRRSFGNGGNQPKTCVLRVRGGLKILASC